MPAPRIPHREPEVVKAEADRHYFGDDEKVATTSIRNLTVDGIDISSRYDKAHELEVMAYAVKEMPESARGLIASIFCDSKAQACYSLTLKPCSRSQAELVARDFERVVLEKSSGHNGIDVSGATGSSFYLDPNWSFEDGFDDQAQ